MRTFSCLVIGENPEEQLQKYHSFRYTGIENQYVVDIDVTKDAIEYIKGCGVYQTLRHYKLYDKDAIITDEQEIDIENRHKYGYAIVQNKKLIKLVIRTNPDSKWKRYNSSDKLLLKGGTKTFQALKRNVDFETAINNAYSEVEKEYNGFQTFLFSNNLEFPKTWNECIAEFKTREKASKFYNDQIAVKIFKKSVYDYKFSDKAQSYYAFGGDPFEYFGRSKESFIERFKYRNILTDSVLKDSEWFSSPNSLILEPTNMKMWTDKFLKLINSTSDNTLLSYYICSV